MNSSADRKALSRGRRNRLKEAGMLTHHKARRFTDERKQASKRACRGKVSE
jgi:hypothetical protein